MGLIVFKQPNTVPSFDARRLLCQPLLAFHGAALQRYHTRPIRAEQDWQVELGPNLLFDAAGLAALAHAIASYRGKALRLSFRLNLSPQAQRDYYSHNPYLHQGAIALPVLAQRAEAGNALADPADTPTPTDSTDPAGGSADSAQANDDEAEHTIDIRLPELSTAIAFPLALTPPDLSCIPLALLMPYSCAHDFLFANQIAIIAQIASELKRAPWRAWRALFSRPGLPLRQRLALYWNRIHPSAQIHPTAVIEGAQIGAGCRIGAHCVVRYSVLGERVQLHDGAKVEYSAVDDDSWLMHDLVLYRSVVETGAFLIHGPYQFSYFQQQSAAFATIMMDYRPDASPIKIQTPLGLRPYLGRFLGALLEPQSKVLGGCLIAPGITIPAGRLVSASSEVIRAKDLL